MVVPFAAGGPVDLLGRIVAQYLGAQLGVPVVIENFPGAGGMPGSQRIARANPDGYSFLLGSIGTHALNQSLYKHPLYNAATDFAPVALIAAGAVGAHYAQGFPGDDLRNSSPMRRRSSPTCNSAPPAPAPRPISAACCSTR